MYVYKWLLLHNHSVDWYTSRISAKEVEGYTFLYHFLFITFQTSIPMSMNVCVWEVDCY